MILFVIFLCGVAAVLAAGTATNLAQRDVLSKLVKDGIITPVQLEKLLMNVDISTWTRVIKFIAIWFLPASKFFGVVAMASVSWWVAFAPLIVNFVTVIGFFFFVRHKIKKALPTSWN